MSTTNNDEAERRAIEDLMPWHAAGTLNRRDTQLVEEALARDPELARRYELVREELAGTVQLNETLGAPSARAMDRLFAKIDAEPARRRMSSPNIAGRFAAFLASLSPPTLAWAASAAAILIVLQTGLIGSVILTGQSNGVFETASAPGSTNAQGAFALVRFAPQASAADITMFLEANKMTITDGPSGGGLYRIRVSGTPLPKAELAGIIKRLQDDKVVGFVAPTE
jgi:anti-sigma factor RsiW